MSDLKEEIEKLKAGTEQIKNETEVFAKAHLTDLGNGKRFARRYGEETKFVKEWGWLVWDEKCWGIDKDGEVERRGKETVLGIHFTALSEADDDTR